jgi:hypothetical protein
MDIAKLNMYKKFDALEDVELNTNLLALQQITAKWYATKLIKGFRSYSY